MGRIVNKKRELKYATGRDLKVPELRRATSALQAASIISHTKLPRLVSEVRMEENRPSNSTPKVPSDSSIFSPTTAGDAIMGFSNYRTGNIYIFRYVVC